MWESNATFRNASKTRRLCNEVKRSWQTSSKTPPSECIGLVQRDTSCELTRRNSTCSVTSAKNTSGITSPSSTPIRKLSTKFLLACRQVKKSEITKHVRCKDGGIKYVRINS